MSTPAANDSRRLSTVWARLTTCMIAAGAALTGRGTARVTGTKSLRSRFRLAFRRRCEPDRRQERTDQHNQQIDLHEFLSARALLPQ